MKPTVLSWLPAPRGSGHWHEQSAKPPLAVICANMFATLASLSRHINLLHSLGCDVAVFTPHPLSLWAPAWAAANARSVLSELERHLACHQQGNLTPAGQSATPSSSTSTSVVRPILWVVMSGSSKAVYAHILSHLGQGQPVCTWQDSSLITQDLLSAAHMREALQKQSASGAGRNAAEAAVMGNVPVQGGGVSTASHGPVQQQVSAQAVQAAQVALKQVLPKPWQHTGWSNMHTEAGSSATTSAYNARPNSVLPIASTAGSTPAPGGVTISYTSQALSKLGSWVQSATQHASKLAGLSAGHAPTSSSNAGASSSTMQGSTSASRAYGDRMSEQRHLSMTTYPLAAAAWCGQWFDSSPVDFTSPSGVAMVEAVLAKPPRSSRPPPSSGVDTTQLTDHQSSPKVPSSFPEQALPGLVSDPFTQQDSTSAVGELTTAGGVAAPQAAAAVSGPQQQPHNQLAMGTGQHPQHLSTAAPRPARAPGPPAATTQSKAPLAAAARSAVLRGVAAAVDFVGFEAWESQRRWMWGVLAGSPVVTRGPTLLTYSWDDPVADPLRIHLLAKALRSRGCLVVEQAWESSPHCGHLKTHPQEAEAAVKQWLVDVQAVWRVYHQARRAVHSSAATGSALQAQQLEPELTSQPNSGLNHLSEQVSRTGTEGTAHASRGAADWAEYYAAQAVHAAHCAQAHMSPGRVRPAPSIGSSSSKQQADLTLGSGDGDGVGLSFLHSKL